MTKDTVFTEESIGLQEGASIRYLKTGEGPGLLLIHGAMRTAKDYMDLAGHLADHFTVYVVNRRGREGSAEQNATYDMQQECDDMLALLRQTDSKFCFGHSYGGVVAFELALRGYPFTKLAVYEPPVVAEQPDSLKELDAALAQEEYPRALAIAFSIASSDGTTPDQLSGLIDAIAGSPMWPQMVKLLPTFQHELKSVMYTRTPIQNYNIIQTETLLMHGDQSPVTTLDHMSNLASILPHSQSVTIASTGHNGPDMDAAEAVGKELIRFFL